MNRVIAVALSGWLVASAGDFAILNIRVVEGEGMAYAAGARATRGITVEITDETGKPVPEATVSFRLPDDGASGTFANGTRTEVATTRQDGRASVWGMHWSKTPGTVEVRITAAKSGVRAGLVSTQHIVAAEEMSKAGRVVMGGGHSKLLIIALAAAAAAGGGIAMGMAKSPKTAAVSPTVALTVGTPSVIVGAP